MVRRHQRNGVADHLRARSVKIVEPPPQPADRFLCAEQRLGRRRAEGADDFRLDDLQLLEEIGRAGGDFIGCRRAVVGRADSWSLTSGCIDDELNSPQRPLLEDQ